MSMTKVTVVFTDGDDMWYNVSGRPELDEGRHLTQIKNVTATGTERLVAAHRSTRIEEIDVER